MSDEAIKKLRELALKASPGPWFADDSWIELGRNEPKGVWGFQSYPVQYCGGPDTEEWIPEGIDSDNDSEYIAAANPQTILKLLDEIESLRSCREELQRLRELCK